LNLSASDLRSSKLRICSQDDSSMDTTFLINAKRPNPRGFEIFAFSTDRVRDFFMEALSKRPKLNLLHQDQAFRGFRRKR